MNQKGSATILTLLISAVMITVAIGFNWIVKEHLKAAEGLKIKTEAMMAARSAYDSLIYHMMTGELAQREIRFAGEQNSLGIKSIPLGGNGIKLANGIVVKVQDSSGLISLVSLDNIAALKRLAAVVGAPKQTVDGLADSFLDWIDADDLSHFNGAERQYYRFEGKPFGPRNFPMQYKEEFGFLKGMDPALYAKMEPFITLLPASGFNPNSAADETLAAFFDIDQQTLDKVRDYLARQPISSDLEVWSLTGKMPKREVHSVFYFPSPFFEITIQVGNPKVLYRLNAGVDIRGQSAAPYGVLYWLEG